MTSKKFESHLRLLPHGHRRGANRLGNALSIGSHRQDLQVCLCPNAPRPPSWLAPSFCASSLKTCPTPPTRCSPTTASSSPISSHNTLGRACQEHHIERRPTQVPPLDRGPDRAHKPHHQGSHRKALPLRRPPATAKALCRLHRRPTAQIPQRPKLLLIYTKPPGLLKTGQNHPSLQK